MKLPNGSRANVDIQGKLLGYCLNRSHRRGRNKALIFEAVLGVTPENAQILRDALLGAAAHLDAKIKDQSDDATKYEIVLPVTGPRGTALVVSGWVIEAGDEIPRLTTCYVKRRTGGSHAKRTETT